MLEAYNNLGTSMLQGTASSPRVQREAARKSIEYFSKIQSKYPDVAAINISKAQRLSGDSPGAARTLEELLRVNPGNESARSALLDLALSSSDSELAYTSLVDWIAATEHSESLRDNRELLENMGRNADVLVDTKRIPELKSEIERALATLQR